MLPHMRMFVAALASCAVVAGTLPAKELTEMSLEELLYTPITVASKTQESVLSAPGTVYVITEDDIKRYGWRDLQEILRAIPNMDLMWQYNWVNGGQRGFTGNFAGTLLLIDGREVQNLLANEVFMSNDFPALRIKRVEILMGPNSTLYDANATQGVINVVTKFGDQGDRNLTEAEYITGDAGTEQLSAVVKRNGKDWEFGFAASHFTSKQNWEELAKFAADDNLYSRDAVKDPYRDHDPSHFNNRQETWTTDFYGRYKGIYGGYDYFKEDNAAGLEYVKYTYTSDEPRRGYRQVYAGYKFDLAENFNGFVEYQNVAESEDWLVSNLVSTATFPAYDRMLVINGQTIDQTSRDRVIAQIDYRPDDRNHIVAGGDWWKLKIDHLLAANNALYPTDTPANLSAGWPVDKEITRKTSVFAQDTFTWVPDKLKLTLGLRFSRQDYTNDNTLPRASIVYQPTPDSALKLTYGEAFRPPSIFEYVNTAGQLDSQKMKMTELNYTRDARLGNLHLSNIAAAYTMEASNLYTKVWVGNAGGAQLTGWKTVVGGSFKVNGIEDTVNFDAGKLNGFFGFRYIQPDKSMVDGQDIVKNVPPTKLKLGLSYAFLKYLNAGIFVDHWDEVKVEANTYPYTFTTDAAGQTVQATEVYTVPAWTSVDLNVNLGEFDLDDATAMFSLSVQNLFDAAYYHGNIRGTSPVQFLQPPRTILAKATFKF